MSEEDNDGALLPPALNAVTVNEYASALVSPVTRIGLLVPCAVCPPREASVASEAVTRYPVVGLPPAAPGTKVTSTKPSPVPRLSIVGGCGGFVGAPTTTGGGGAEGALLPPVLNAVTVKV